MLFRVVLGWVVLGWVVPGWSCPARAENQAAVRERVHRAAELTSLDADGLKPWHLKLDIELFGEDGKSKGQGSVEEWWASPTTFRVVYTMPSGSVTELHNADGAFRSAGAPPTDPTMDLMVRQVVRPMPTDDELDHSTPDLRSQAFGKVKLDCVMLGQPLRDVDYPPLGVFPTYCFDVGGDSLRLTYSFGGLALVRERLGTFQGKKLALNIVAQEDNKTLAKATVALLRTEVAPDGDFLPSAEMVKLGGVPEAVPANVVSGRRLRQVLPVYPSEAKRLHISGAVTLTAVIGRDGRVRSLVPVSYPNGMLALSAIVAVQRWTYEPYLLNGVPTEINTTITVNYNMSSR